MKTRDKTYRERIFSTRGKDEDGNVHIPNKIESKELRKLMSKTGLSEKELRDIKKYRKILADVAKTANIVKTTQRDRRLKIITKFLKLAKEHPTVLYVLNNTDYWCHYDYVSIKNFIESEKFKAYLRNEI